MTTANQSQANYMSRPITTFLAFASCVLLLVFCSKEEPEIDFSDPLSFNCNSSQLICTRPDSLGPFGEMDCDNGGISSFHECVAKTNFNDPSDDCEAAVKAKVNICLLLQIDPDSVELGFRSDMVLSDQDCDGGGISNYEECINGFNPIKSNDVDEENNLLDDKEIEAYLAQQNFTDSLMMSDSSGIIGSNETQDLIKTESGALVLVERNATGVAPTFQDSVIYQFSSTYLATCMTLDNCDNPIPCEETTLTGLTLDTSQVSNLVFGLQEGLGYIKQNSTGKVIVPSRLAYGSLPSFGVPAYSVLIFDIEVDSIF